MEPTDRRVPEIRELADEFYRDHDWDRIEDHEEEGRPRGVRSTP